MRHTKQVLKDVFGSKENGFEYLKKWRTGDKKTPVLFVYTEQDPTTVNDFANWLTSMVHDADVFSGSQFTANKVSKNTVIVKDIGKVSEDMLDEVIKAMKNDKRIVVAASQRPTILDFIHDASLRVAKLEAFDMDKANEEIQDLLKEIS
ncbi:hypothetical protein V6R21_18535 [Limibacter armeniacum]|uniref:hypothetical protein n=1 Tax=Limibacter armeniacum TaxID=466084 RepID=UPI002FE68E75